MLRTEVNTKQAALYRAQAESTKLVMDMQHMAMAETRAREEAEAKSERAASRECSASAEKAEAQMQVLAVFLSPPPLCHICGHGCGSVCVRLRLQTFSSSLLSLDNLPTALQNKS